ncbi:MAG TPA: TRAP transporter substrate-binding protein [Burkholderiales bacterium]|nr:TRAP transporter substrate-binding protein [Burkholderiales bacterium]
MTPIALRFGGYQEPASVHNRAAARFGELLLQRLGERIRFELIGNVLKLGRPSGELPAMVEAGELDFCYISTVRFARAVPELRLLELPFVVADRRAACAAFLGEFGALIGQRMRESTPFRLLGLWDNGFRHITNRVRPIRSPEDCRGLAIRSQVSELHVEVFRALGFVPVPVDVKEFVEQIESGRFDAQENPLTNTYHFGVHRHHRYITLSGHLFGAAAMICQEARFRGWPAEVREAVLEAAREATAFQHRIAAAEDEQVLARLDPAENEVISLTDAERAAFVRATEPVLAKYRDELDPKLFAYLGS